MAAEQGVLTAGWAPQQVPPDIDTEPALELLAAVVAPPLAELHQEPIARFQRLVEAQVVSVVPDGTVGMLVMMSGRGAQMSR